MKGKLVISMIWLVLAFIGIISATFAWFSENRSVDAGGMNVEAETVMNLLISNNSSTGFATSATSSIASNDAAKLTPASSVPTVVNGGLVFYAPTSDTKANHIDYASGTLGDGARLEQATITSTTPASNATYSVMKHTFYVKVDGTATDELYNLYVSNIVVTRAATTSNISKALRVAVVCDNVAYFYSVTGGQTSYEGISGLSENTPYYTHETVSAPSTFAQEGRVLKATVDNTPVQIDVYVWYEGQDTACTSTNSLTVENLSVAVTFSASDTNE